MHEAKQHLTGVLATLRAIHWHYWSSHWQVFGDAFYGDHLLFQRLYESVEAEIDTLAEKMVGFFGPTSVDPTHQIQLTSRLVESVQHHTCLFARSIAYEKGLNKLLKHAYDRINANNQMTLGLDDFLQSVANQHETNLYLLQQRTHNQKYNKRAQYEVVTERGRKIKLPANLYHVAFVKDLDSIQSKGLVAGRGDNFGGGYQSHSKGRVFLTSWEGVDFWFSRYEMVAENRTDNPEEGWIPVALKVSTRKLPAEAIGYDEPGSRDSRADAFYVEVNRISPSDLEIFDGGGWVSLSSVDEADLLDEALEAAEIEEFDDEEPAYYMDFEVFLPDRMASKIAKRFLK